MKSVKYLWMPVLLLLLLIRKKVDLTADVLADRSGKGADAAALQQGTGTGSPSDANL